MITAELKPKPYTIQYTGRNISEVCKFLRECDERLVSEVRVTNLETLSLELHYNFMFGVVSVSVWDHIVYDGYRFTCYDENAFMTVTNKL